MPESMPEFVRELGGIKEYRLANGLQILLFPDETQSSTSVSINYRVGSRQEASGEYGMSHLLEHMLFKGTPSHRDIPEAAAQRGMIINAHAQNDRTVYENSFNANPETLTFTLALEADRMLNSLISKADLDKEMTVVRNEFEQHENNPFQQLVKQVLGAAYQWHNYGHTVIGAKSDIENVPIERLQAFYKRYYRPDNATLMLAGNFALQPTLAQIAKLFGHLKSPSEPIPPSYTVEPAQDGQRSVTVQRLGGQPMLLAYYHVPAVTHPDTPALLLLGDLLSEEPRGALYRQLVQHKFALAASLSGIGGVDPGGITAIAQLAPGTDMAKAEAMLLDVVEGHAGPALQEADLQRMRELTKQVYQAEIENPMALMEKIMDYGPDWRMRFLLMEELDKVTLADLERVRNTYLRPSNRTVGRYLPSKTVARVEIPAAPALQERMAKLQGPAKITEGEHFNPTLANLAQRTQTRQIASGITLTTLAKHTRGKQVQLLLRLKWGEYDTAFRDRGHALLANLVTQGTTSQSRQELQDRLAQLKAKVNITSDHQGMTLRLEAAQDTLLPALAIATDVIRNPLLPQGAFDWTQQAVLAEYEGSRHSLETLTEMALRQHYNQAQGVGPDHPDYIASVEERIARIKNTTLEDVRRFHKKYWSANLAQVVAVGDIPAGLDSTLNQLLGDWKKPDAPPYVRHIAQAVKIKPAQFEAQASDLTGAAFMMASHFALNDRDADYMPLAVAAYIFGNGMESRLSVRVRQQAGLSYGVGANLNAAHFGNASSLVLTGTFAPQNRKKMLALVEDEVQRMGRAGITEAELARCKRTVLEALQQERGNDEVLSDLLMRQLDYGENWDWEMWRDQKINALTVAQVNAAWRKYIKPNDFVVVTAGDFKS